MANPYGKTRKIDEAYATYTDPNMPDWEWKILKLNQRPDKAADGRWAIPT
jgi:hypothetical protein